MPSPAMRITCLLSTLIFFTVYLPIIILLWSKLLRIRFHPVFKSRLSHITMLIIIAITIHIIVNALYLLELGNFIPFNIEVLQYAGYFILSYSLLLRFWLYHYNIEFEDLTDNQEWKAIIDGNMEDEMRNDWYMLNKKTYGSWKWLIKRFCILPILGGIIFPAIIFSIINNLNVGLTYLYIFCIICEVILTLIPIFGILWLVGLKLNEFKDVLYISDEFARLKYLSLLSIVGIAIVIGAVTSFSGSAFEDGHDDNVLALVLMHHLETLVLMGMVYVSSWWVVNKLVNTRHIRLHKLFETDRRGSYSATFDGSRELSFTDTSISISEQPSVSQNDSEQPASPKEKSTLKENKKKGLTKSQLSKLHFLLSHDQTLDLFMLHLKKEFQEEILLSLIEFTQYREYVNWNLKERGEDIKDETEEKNAGQRDKKLNTRSVYGYETLKLSDNCPRSKILEMEVPEDVMERFQDAEVREDILKLQWRTHKLFEKYVASGRAEYEINISYQLRRRLAKDFDNLETLVRSGNYNKLADFDGIWSLCLEEQWKYCTNSILRFRQSKSFQRIVEYFGES